MTYGIADRVVQSDIPFPELRVESHIAPHWRVNLGRSGERARKVRPFHYWNAAGGYRWASFARDGGRLILHFARTARFEVCRASGQIVCYPIGRTAVDALRPVLLNQVFPLVFGEERLVLHASAVATPAGALVFVGAPGVGKSTLASALALRGLPLITDDFLVVDQQQSVPQAVPSGIEPRLWPDSLAAILPGVRRRFPLVGRRTMKRRLSPAGMAGVALADRTIPIARLFVLSEAEPPGAISRMSASLAVSTLTASTFVVRVDEPSVVRNTFARVTSLVSRVPVQRLGAARDFGALDTFCRAVCDVPLSRAG